MGTLAIENAKKLVEALKRGSAREWVVGDRTIEGMPLVGWVDHCNACPVFCISADAVVYRLVGRDGQVIGVGGIAGYLRQDGDRYVFSIQTPEEIV